MSTFFSLKFFPFHLFILHFSEKLGLGPSFVARPCRLAKAQSYNILRLVDETLMEKKFQREKRNIDRYNFNRAYPWWFGKSS